MVAGSSPKLDISDILPGTLTKNKSRHINFVTDDVFCWQHVLTCLAPPPPTDPLRCGVCQTGLTPHHGSVPVYSTGLHVGFLLPSILDRPKACVPEETRCRDPVGGIRVHQEHLGAGHILREREAVVFPHRDHKQRVHPYSSLRQHHEEYTVSHESRVTTQPAYSTGIPDSEIKCVQNFRKEILKGRDVDETINLK